MRDQAQFYGVPTKRHNEQVKRNRERFPEDFMFSSNLKKMELIAKFPWPNGILQTMTNRLLS